MNFNLPAYGWTPRPDQLQMWNALMDPDFRDGTIVAHRRWGKDETCLQMLAIKAMERVGSYFYCLPEYEQARKALWTMVNWRTKRTRIADAFPPEIVKHTDNDAMKLTLVSGSSVQLVGSDRIDSLVGGGQIGIVMSEAALSNPHAEAFFSPILEESHGWMLRVSTPRGKNHFHRAYEAGLEDQRAGVTGVHSWLLPASRTRVFDEVQLARQLQNYQRKYGQKVGKALFEQEYLCSFDAAILGAVWGDELTQLEAQQRTGLFPHDHRHMVHTSWDIGVGDSTAILFWQLIGSAFVLIDGFEANDLGLDTYIDVLKMRKAEFGYRYGKHIAPHDIKQREWVKGVSRMDEAKRMGLNFTRQPAARLQSQIGCGAALIRKMYVNKQSPGAMACLDRFKAYRYPVSKAGLIIPRPVHDDASHASSALMTFAVHHAAKLGTRAEYDSDLADLGGNGQRFDPRDHDPAYRKDELRVTSAFG